MNDVLSAIKNESTALTKNVPNAQTEPISANTDMVMSPAIAGTANVTLGIKLADITTVISALITAQKVILILLFILTTRYQVAAHTFTATVRTDKSLADITGTALVTSAVVSVRVIVHSARLAPRII